MHGRSSFCVPSFTTIKEVRGKKVFTPSSQGKQITASTTNHITPLLETNEDLALAGKVSIDSTDFLSLQIMALEAKVEGKVELREPWPKPLTIPGVGKILRLTIVLETGPISRFDKAGKYASY